VTEVVLTHSGWEKLGEEGEQARANYGEGWGTVFKRIYKQAADGVASKAATV
jgi:hypothetical protein